MIGLAGLGWTYALAAACGALGLYGVSFINAKRETSGNLSGHFLKSFLEGFHYVRGHELILGIMALDMFAVLFGGAVSILPAFVKEVLNAGPETLGILRPYRSMALALKTSPMQWPLKIKPPQYELHKQ